MSSSSEKGALPIAVLASGRGSNLEAIIDAVEAGRLNADIRAVISDRPEAYALERAKAHSIPVEVMTKKEWPEREAFDRELARRLESRGVELVVLAGFMRLLSNVMLKAFPMRIMNIHPSLLPSFPGLDVQRKAVEHGVKFSGCTVHFVDDGLDSGPIIAQAVVPVLDTDTPEDLAERILAEEHRIYPRAISLYAQGRLAVSGRRVIIQGATPPEHAVENPEGE